MGSGRQSDEPLMVDAPQDEVEKHKADDLELMMVPHDGKLSNLRSSKHLNILCTSAMATLPFRPLAELEITRRQTESNQTVLLAGTKLWPFADTAVSTDLQLTG